MIFPKSSKFLTSEQGAQEVPMIVVFLQAKFIFVNFQKKNVIFWEISLEKLDKPKCNISNNIIL